MYAKNYCCQQKCSPCSQTYCWGTGSRAGGFDLAISLNFGQLRLAVDEAGMTH